MSLLEASKCSDSVSSGVLTGDLAVAASYFQGVPLLAGAVVRPHAVDTQLAAHSCTCTFVDILAGGTVLLQEEPSGAGTALCTHPGREESRVM